MQANWSLVLNILLLFGVVVAIARTMKERRKKTDQMIQQPSVARTEPTCYDDIISVRRVEREEPVIQPAKQPDIQVDIKPEISISPATPSASPSLGDIRQTLDTESSSPVMLFLLAKENRQLAGYELLQTLLAAGLRFGEGHLFHRHQHLNGQGPVLCSLAAATASGVFDLQNIGAFSVRGLCMFMHASGNAMIDAERFEVMLDTARQLSEGLDTHLLDAQRRPLSDANLQRYYQRLGIVVDVCEREALA